MGKEEMGIGVNVERVFHTDSDGVRVRVSTGEIVSVPGFEIGKNVTVMGLNSTESDWIITSITRNSEGEIWVNVKKEGNEYDNKSMSLATLKKLNQ